MSDERDEDAGETFDAGPASDTERLDTDQFDWSGEGDNPSRDGSDASVSAAELKRRLHESVREYFATAFGEISGDADGSAGHGTVSTVRTPTGTVEFDETTLADAGVFFDTGERDDTSSTAGRSLRATLARLFAGPPESGPVDRPPSAEFLTERWFDLSVLDEYEVEDHYWVQCPFAHVTILFDSDEKRRFYHVTEPTLNEFERHLRDTLVRVLRSDLMYQDLELSEDRSAVFARELRNTVNEYAATVDPGTVHKLVYYLVRDFLEYGEIDPIMRDENIEDISCDGARVPVFVFHGQYRDLQTNVVFEESRLNSLTIRLAQMANKQISVSRPLVDGTLPDGSRIQLTLGGDVSQRGSNFTIRKFSEIPLTPIDLIQYNTFSVEQMAYFWLAIENGRSLVFAGGTGSGKTTSMNAVSFFIPPDSKVVSIEDTLEITLPHTNWVQSVTRDSASASGRGEVSTYELLQAALRQRPEYILVGEVRTDPKVALTFFQAIGTGHTAYTTFHSDSVDGVLSRLQNPPLEVPAQMLRELDIVSIQKQVFQGRDRVRRNDGVAELGAGDDRTTVTPRHVFERDASSDSFRQVDDSHVLAEIARERGWDEAALDEALSTRERVLRYLIDEGITHYRDVAAVLHTFARDPEYIIEQVDSGALNASQLRVEQ